MEEFLKYAFDHKYILIGIITALMGASARISYEKETKVKKTEELLQYWELERLTGVACALAGLISIDIIRILIEELPNIVRKKLNTEHNKKNN